jgi:hypothetical protein
METGTNATGRRSGFDARQASQTSGLTYFSERILINFFGLGRKLGRGMLQSLPQPDWSAALKVRIGRPAIEPVQSAKERGVGSEHHSDIAEIETPPTMLLAIRNCRRYVRNE